MGNPSNEIQTIHLSSISGVNKHKQIDEYVRPNTRPDALFNFTKKMEWLEWSIINKRLSPRYNIEDITYLKIKGMRKLAFPMKCFCDINLHQIKEHLRWYGYYGLSFTKEWGLKQKIQPIQYINPKSLLASDFSISFQFALDRNSAGFSNDCLSDFVMHQLLYYKPYSGHVVNHQKKKCFVDESEWRFIPNIVIPEMPLIIRDKELVKDDFLFFANNELKTVEGAALRFEYSDIKYIILKTQSDFDELIEVLEKLNIEKRELYLLVSKIVIWNSSKGDF